jgi:hypothetical protein
MPTLVQNALSVVGEPDGVAEFVASARGRLPPTGDKPRKPRKNEPQPVGVPMSEYVQEFCFHALVPLPPRYSEVPYNAHNLLNRKGGDGGFQMECDTWGTKWGAMNTWIECDPGAATYHFETAWCAPHEIFLPKVAARFPNLLFLISWCGEQPTRGRAWFRGPAAARRNEPYRAHDYPTPGPEDRDKPGAWDAFEGVADARRRTHPLWVGLTLAVRGGYAFDPARSPGPVLADWLQERDYHVLAAQVRGLDPTEPVGPCPAPARLAREATRRALHRRKLS